MRSRSPGQSMVELALILPLLLAISMGIIDGGYYIASYSELENAARRASEIASKAAPNNTACINIARSEAIKSVFLSDTAPAKLVFSFTYPSGRAVERPAVVNLSYTGTFITPIARGLFGSTFSFNFSSRRTILSTAPLFDTSNNPVSCS